MRLIENSDEIIIRHVPFGKWIIGGTLIFIFCLFSIWLIYPAIYSSSESLNLLPLFIFGAAVILIAVFDISLNSMIFAPLRIVTINEKTKSVDIVHQRFYGSETERYYFHQIEKFKSYKGTVSFSSRYFLALILANRKVIKLRIPVGDDKQETIKLIKKLNKFMKPKDFQKSVGDKQLF